MKRSDIIKRIIVSCYVAVPLISSIISTVHLVDLFYLGNPSWISISLAIAIEVGSVASFLTLSILSKLNKFIVWSMFFVLFFMQIIGNVFFSYSWIEKMMETNPNWIKSFQEMIGFFVDGLSIMDVKMYLSLLIGVPIPLISVFLLKSAVDYIGSDEDKFEAETKKEELEEISSPNKQRFNPAHQ